MLLVEGEGLTGMGGGKQATTLQINPLVVSSCYYERLPSPGLQQEQVPYNLQ